jgi:uroporphyrinogen III methyltransferase/synthase
MVQPAIEISPPADWRPVDDALARLEQFDWLVFSSANGVRYLLDRLLVIGGDARRLGHVRLAAIGPGTADELARYHLRADLVPDQYRAESLADALISWCWGDSCTVAPHDSPPRLLLARASRGREVLAEKLAAAGATVDQIVVYRSSDVAQAEPEAAAALAEGRIDWITVTSSAIARSLARLFGENLRRSKLASISPLTSGVLRELGFEPAAEAAEYTMAGLVDAILAAL